MQISFYVSVYVLFCQIPGLFVTNSFSCFSMLRNSTHETFAEKLYQKFKDNPHFSKPKFSRSGFTVHHYAGNVGNMFLIYI
jgi:hypothetical protein